jgi:hypothetical protein
MNYQDKILWVCQQKAKYNLNKTVGGEEEKVLRLLRSTVYKERYLLALAFLS